MTRSPNFSMNMHAIEALIKFADVICGAVENGTPLAVHLNQDESSYAIWEAARNFQRGARCDGFVRFFESLYTIGATEPTFSLELTDLGQVVRARIPLPKAIAQSDDMLIAAIYVAAVCNGELKDGRLPSWKVSKCE